MMWRVPEMGSKIGSEQKRDRDRNSDWKQTEIDSKKVCVCVCIEKWKRIANILFTFSHGFFCVICCKIGFGITDAYRSICFVRFRKNEISLNIYTIHIFPFTILSCLVLDVSLPLMLECVCVLKKFSILFVWIFPSFEKSSFGNTSH